MASAQNESDEEQDSQDVRIVLLGVSGAGKSSIGNAILGREVFKETTTRESEKHGGRVEDRNISIVDTPGFFNSHLTDEELLEQMMKSLFLSHPGPHVFLLVINLENFRDEKRNVVEKILGNFGKDVLKFTMVLFVGREKVSRREWNQMSESENMKELLSHFEGRFQVINSKNECDSFQIAKLLRSIVKMVENNGNQNYSNEIYLKNMMKLGEQKEKMKLKQEKETMKEEQVWRDMEMKERQEERDIWKRKEAMNQGEEIKTKSKEENIKDDSERKHEDVKKKKTQYLRKNESSVQEDLRKQMESRRERERQRWAFEKETMTRQKDLRIMILGKSGVGKTSTVTTILGRNALKAEASVGTLISEKQEAVVSGRTISIIDTPGFQDTPWYKQLKNELKLDIEESFELSAPGPHIFLLIIRLNGRHTEDEKNTMNWVLENFGNNVINHIIVLFTYADFLMGEPLDQYIRKSPDLQSLVKNCGGRYHSLNNQNRNQNQVTELLEKMDKLLKDNSGEHYSFKKSSEGQKQTAKDDMRQLSPQEKEQTRGTNAESKDDENEGDRSQESTERQRDLHRETGRLLGLMMGLELTEMAMNLSLLKAMSESLSKQGLRIVLLGLVGSGKSSAGNTILRRDVFTVNPLSITEGCEKQAAVVSGKPISVVDTPPIVLGPLWFILQYEIEKSLEMSAPGPHVFLLVMEVQILTEERKNEVKWVQEKIEKDALNHTIVLFTHTDLLNSQVKDPLKVYISLHSELESLIVSCGGRYHSISNEESGNHLQVIELLMKMDELVQENGGRHYTKQNIFKRGQKTKEKDDSCEIL